jgi:hypothetical protein
MIRSSSRIKTTGEIFTPPLLVDHILDELSNRDDDLFTDPTKLFLDPACGDGEFLRGVIRKFKQARGLTFVKNRWQWYHSISTQVLGVDLMWDNVCDTVYHLLRSRYDEDIVQLKEIKQNGLYSPSMSPEEINQCFLGRTYIDSKGSIEIRKMKDSNHYIQYRFGKTKSWTNIENIVRANSLTEWDFKNWEPKHKFIC